MLKFAPRSKRADQFSGLLSKAVEVSAFLARNLRYGLNDFLKLQLEPTPIYLDNDGAKALSQDPVGRFKNKHVRMAHHFTQELVAAGSIKTAQISTADNCADVLTKALGPTIFPRHASRFVADTKLQPSALQTTSVIAKLALC